MRIARFFIAYGVVSVLGVLVSLFLAQNTQPERLTFFGQDVSTSLAWIMLGATAVGFLLALLLLLPGRIAATLHIWSLRRETRDLDEELVWQSEQHDELLAHHERLLTGHEWLLSAHRRTRAELDHAIGERDALKERLAIVATALADLQETHTRQSMLAQATPRKVTAIPQPVAPLAHVEARAEARVEDKVPVVVAVSETAGEAEGAQEEMETPTLITKRLHVSQPEPREAPDVIQQAQTVVAEADTTSEESEELEPLHASVSIGERFANGKQELVARLDGWRQAVISFSSRLYSQGAYSVDQAHTRLQYLGSTAWAFILRRMNELGGKPTEARTRVPSMSHPK